MGFLEVLYIIVPIALAYSAPLIIAALGGIFSERSGVVNIALEGLMVMGAFTGVVTALTLSKMGLGAASPWLAMLIAIVVGAVFSLFLAIPAILFRADQTVLGVAINLLAVGLAIFLVRALYGKGQTDSIPNRISKENVPFLSDIPVLTTHRISRSSLPSSRGTSFSRRHLVFVYVLSGNIRWRQIQWESTSRRCVSSVS